jgi:hypothetical protein
MDSDFDDSVEGARRHNRRLFRQRLRENPKAEWPYIKQVFRLGPLGLFHHTAMKLMIALRDNPSLLKEAAADAGKARVARR